MVAPQATDPPTLCMMEKNKTDLLNRVLKTGLTVNNSVIDQSI